MSWLLRHRLRAYVQSSLWLAPAASIPLAIGFAKLVRMVAERTDWVFIGIGPEGARALLAAYVGSTLSFIVFVFSMLLLAVQMASAQLSPRVIGSFLRNRAGKIALSVFVFSNMYAIGAMARVEDRVVELPVFVASLLMGASVLAFLYLIDHVGRSLRPVSIISGLGANGLRVVDIVYPQRFVSEKIASDTTAHSLGEPTRTVTHDGSAGVLLAFDAAGLVRLARKNECVVVLVPQVGDFIAMGEALFRVYGSGAVDDGLLRSSLALGAERSLEQDPAFCFRILVEIASKALSPAINDPATAVLALDQLHRLLRSVAQKDLDTGHVHDETGALRLVYRTPDWEDFVSIAVAEIRLFGANSLQIARRLRAMLDNVLEVAPASRHQALHEELELLRRSVERSFLDPEDRRRASIGDLQGVGGSDDEV